MLIIGLDIGTTGTKAVVFDEKGTVRGRGYKEYGIITDADGGVTQNAADWKNAVIYSVREACKTLNIKEIAAIGISTQGSSMAASKNTDDAGIVYTWMDRRACEQSARLEKAIGQENLYRKTGWVGFPGGDAAKILWLKENGLLKGDEKLISTLSYINCFLTGRFVCDPTNSAMRQLYNIQENRWDAEILDFLGIRESNLPEILTSGAFVGTLTENAAQELGLDRKTAVYNGAHDQYCAAIGCGAVHPGDMMLATGTTWVTLGVTEEPLYTDSHISPGIHPAGGFGAIASQVNAGSALKWWKNQINESYQTMDREAEKRIKNAQDLFWIPYFTGSGFPDNDPRQRSRILGLSIHHDKFDMACALMEGIVFEAARINDEYIKHGFHTKKLLMTGGAANSPFWTSLVGALFSEYELYISECTDTSCVGAAVLAGVGCGVFTSPGEASAMNRLKKIEPQDAVLTEHYHHKFNEYCKLL